MFRDDNIPLLVTMREMGKKSLRMRKLDHDYRDQFDKNQHL